MATYCIDYFATLGLPPNQPLLFHNFTSFLSPKPVHPSLVWSSAITDINIVFYENDDEIPEDDENGNFPIVISDGIEWELLKYTVEGQLGNCHPHDISKGKAYFMVRRRSVTKRLDHIVDIAVLHRGDPVPDGYEVIIKSLCPESHPDTINNPTRIAVKRASADASALIHGEKIVDDICLVNVSLGETPPSDYIVVDQSLDTATLTTLRSVERVHLIYHHQPPMGICDLPFQPSTLDRYPMRDHQQFPLPATELPVFVFPHYLHLKYRPRSNFPLPNFFTFVFTDVKGRHLYTACLRFYEILSFELVQNAAREIYGPDVDIVLPLSEAFFFPKVICVVSQFPFYRAMGRYLKQLYSLSLSPTFCPLEYFISSVVSKVPLPVEGGRPFHVVLDAALISLTSKSMAPISFDLPSKYSFPHMDVDFAGPMRCLSVEHLLAVFTLLLRESKVVFICNSNALLTEVMETFRSLLYPLSWSSCFITRLPDSLSGVLQAPGGFMIGMHVVNSDIMDVTDVKINDISHKFEEEHIDSVRFIADHDWIHNLQSGTFIADLTQNRLYLYENRKTEYLSSARISQILKSLPSPSYRKLYHRIQVIAEKYQLCPQKFDEVGLSQFDSAFDFSGDPKRNWKDFPTNDVRDAFLAFMCEVLADFSKYIRPPTLAGMQGATVQELFRVEDYVRDADKSLRVIINNLLETQMFAYLIQQRIEEPSLSAIFFDQSVRVLTDLNLNSLSGDKRTLPTINLDRQTIMLSEKDAETPLYELVACFNELANAFSLSRKPPTLTDIIGKRKRQHHSRSNSLESFGSYDSDTGTPKLVIQKRQELQQARHGMDLQLDDMGKGPLIIPGPSKIDNQVIVHAPDECDDLEYEERPSSVRFRYTGGWPDLDVALLEPSRNLQPGLDLLHKNRIKSLTQIDSRYQYFIRPRIYRTCYQSYQSLLRSIQMDMTVESKCATSIILDIYGNSLLVLSIRTMNGVNPIGSVLQIMAILYHLEQIKILKLLDDAIWRSIFVACSSISDESFSHKAICTLFGALQSLNIHVDPVVYTMYCNCFSTPATKKGQSSTDVERFYLEPFYHLEQLGIAWLIQKCSISHNEINTNHGADKHFSPEVSKSPESTSPGNGFWGILTGKKKISKAIVEETASPQSEMATRLPYSTLTSDLSKILQLSRGESLFKLRKPRNLLLALFPTTTTPDEFPNIDKVLLSDHLVARRISEIQDLYEQLHCQNDLKSKSQNELEFRDENSPILIVGKFEIAVVAVKGVVAPMDALIKNIYVRCWLSTNSGVQLKSQPTVVHVSDSSSLDTIPDINVDFLPFPLVRPKNITVYFEVFGDFMKSNSASCYAFDQSLGLGTIPIEKIADNLTQEWVKLSYSTIGEKVVQLELLISTKFSAQEDSRSFFANRKDSHRGKSQSLPHDQSADKSPARESDGANKDRFSWTRKFTSVFSMNKPQRHSNIKQDVVFEEIEQPNIVENEANVHEETPQLPPEDILENKSKKWRNSLALLTGEIDLGDVSSADLVDSTGDEPNRRSLRRSVDSVLSMDSDQEANSRPSSMDLTSAPKVVNKKRLSVSEHPLELGEILEEPLAIEVPQDEVKKSDSHLESEKSASVPDSPSAPSITVSPVEHSTRPRLGRAPPEVEHPREGSITTEIAGSVKSEYENIQHIADIQSYYTKHYDKIGLGIFSSTPCGNCEHTLLDEEFMSAWGGFCDHPRDMTSDIYSSHFIICPACKHEIVPRLHIRLYKLVPLVQSTQASEFVEETSKLESIWSAEVRHLSPFGVRLLTEHILEEEGFHIAEADWMLVHYPDLYWNSLWYSIRLNLPNGFYSSKNLSSILAAIPSNSPLVAETFVWASNITIAWRECVLKSKIFRILLDGHGEGFLTLQNIFPTISKEDEILASEIINSMDGTVGNLAHALKKVNQLSSVWNLFSGTKGRKLYLSLLTLVQYYHPSCLVQHSPDVPHGLSKGTQFDRALIEALSIAFTQRDFENLQTKENELNLATSNRAAQAIRIALGTLL